VLHITAPCPYTCWPWAAGNSHDGARARHLRADSEAHNIILTEPALNTPDAREAAAEVLFEGFSVPGLHIGVQAVFALYAAFGRQARRRRLAPQPRLQRAGSAASRRSAPALGPSFPG